MLYYSESLMHMKFMSPKICSSSCGAYCGASPKRYSMITTIRTQYVFFLVCCYGEGCPHPLCQLGRPENPLRWYARGPLLTELPLPVPDPARPWGSTSCPSCKGFGAGLYKANVFTDVKDKQNNNLWQSLPLL